MTTNDDAEFVKKTVLAFDICSSTDILEDLHRTDNVVKWRDFLSWMEKYLFKEAKKLPFNIYNFTGDGWLLLFEYEVDGQRLLEFLENFCRSFSKRFKRNVISVLESPPDIIGITFGMDRGRLLKIKMNKRYEYVGRAMNVACRLQSGIKQKDQHPEYKILMTKHFYNSIKPRIPEERFTEVKRTLRNIAGGKEIRCMKAILYDTGRNVSRKRVLKPVSEQIS